ncbi:hypothetical protein [Halomonas sp. NO4]|uniref:hypothetical protein n=1 Tax=Halomonas sp. NO4 TaxID=2484813 RepID=UPI0013D23980|nr:hypothetical protein [Halomonas sp. NO4]
MALSEYTDIELLRELLSRNRLQPTPYHRIFASPHQEAVVGIGADHTADITLDEDALALLNLAGSDPCA